jgi:ATP-dependent RNA helicase RhlE
LKSEAGELYMHRIGRTGADATGTALSFITPREEESKVEVLMNMELVIEPFPEEVEISDKLIEPKRQTSY